MKSAAPLHDELYDMLLDYADLAVEVEELVVGQNWTLCKAGSSGVARTVAPANGRPSWQGVLRGRQLNQLAFWLTDWDRSRASIGLAAVNAALNREADIVTANGAIFKGNDALTNSIEWFMPMLRGKRVALFGPESEAFATQSDKFSLQHFSSNEGCIHPASDSVLAECDWAFINASAIADKTLPHLLQRAASSRVVLYGAELPWLDEWHHFGVDYLLGCEVDSDAQLQTAICEGQDVEQSAEAIRFRLINLQPAHTVVPLESVSPLRRVASA